MLFIGATQNIVWKTTTGGLRYTMATDYLSLPKSKKYFLSLLHFYSIDAIFLNFA